MSCDTYYLEDGSSFKKSDLVYLGEGANARVWKCGNSAFKEFIPSHIGSGIDKRLGDIFSEINFSNLPNFYSFVRWSKSGDVPYIGYMMEYFEEDKKASILDLPISTIVSSFRDLERDIEAISDFNILMSDVTAYNTMITSDGKIHTFDYDMYLFSEGNDALRRNKVTELKLLHGLFLYYTSKDTDISMEDKIRYEEFFRKAFAIRNCYDREVSGVVLDLFDKDTTPREGVKRLVYERFS